MEHPLRAYRRRIKLSLDKLADAVGASKATLSRVETGDQSPSLDLIRRLVTETSGEVTANDFMTALPPAPAEQERRAG